MKRETIKPIGHRQWFKWRIIVIAATIGAIVATVMALLDLRDLRSRAQITQARPGPFASTPAFTLTPPFLALSSSKTTFGFREKVPVAIYLHTASKDTLAADVVVTYDPKILEITQNDIEIEDVYKSVAVESSVSGKLTLSFFIRPEIGHPAVKTGFPSKIATLTFKTKTLETNHSAINLEFDPNADVSTRLIPYAEVRPEKPANILETVAGVEISVVP